jgi:hypothetical protein
MPAVLRGRKKACAAVLVGALPNVVFIKRRAWGLDRGRRRGLLM